MKKGAFTCGLDAALFVLGGKWKPLILFHLAHGTRRYGELRRAVGNVCDKVLIQQLKQLQQRLLLLAVLLRREWSKQTKVIARRANHQFACPAPFAKIFRFRSDPNHFYIPRRLVPQRGVSRS
jgi:hypothetical protein